MQKQAFHDFSNYKMVIVRLIFYQLHKQNYKNWNSLLFMYYTFLFIPKLGILYVFFNKTTIGVLFHLGLPNFEV